MFTSTNKMRQNRIRELADAMKDLEVGKHLTHPQIAKLTGLSPCPYDIFKAAHVLANQEAGCYFDSVRGLGYIKMPGTEWDGVAKKYRTRARKQASTGRKFITNIVAKTNTLTDEEQRRASREIGLMQTIEAMTRRIANSA
jgi:hypothetical protein